MRILLARHGETQWNFEGRYQGQEDIPLSETGRKQAQSLSTRLCDVQIDAAFSSPLKRARETAELALAERASLLKFDPRLMEINHGEWEGLLAAEIHARDPELLQAWRDTPDSVLMPEGESLKHVLDRAWAALTDIIEQQNESDTVLIVAHDAVNRVLLCRILGIPYTNFWRFRQAPTTLNLLEGDSIDTLNVVRINDCSHHTPYFGEAVHRAL